MLLLVLAALVVGFLIGTVGVGGILLIPAFIGLAGLTPHQASATALFTFIFTGILGTILFQRQGSVDWRQTLTVCAGAIVFSFVGAMTKEAVGDLALMRVIASLLIVAGLYVFMPRPAGLSPPAAGVRRTTMLLVIGALAGFGSGFSGAGGPLFSVPLMVVAGFNPLLAVGTSQVLQIFSAGSGTLANLSFGEIRWSLVVSVTLAELLGVIAGVKLAHSLNTTTLRLVAGVVCVLVGAGVLLQYR